MAQGLIQIYGMSSEFGLRSYQQSEGLRAYSESTAEKIDLEVKNLVDRCYKEVEELLVAKKELIAK
jgi:ATP-dependent Zn protease